MPTRTLVADHLTPTLAYAKLRKGLPGGARFVYESAHAGERWTRYSLLGVAPAFELRLDREGDLRALGECRGYAIDPSRPLLEQLQLPPARTSAPGALRFQDGLFGYVAYDLVHRIAKVPAGDSATWDAHYVPLIRLFGGFQLVVFDNLQSTVTLIADDDAALDRLQHALDTEVAFPLLPLPERTVHGDEAALSVDIEDAAYRELVERCQEYVRAGDAFQIVPSRQFSVQTGAIDPLLVYRAARILNPAPYMYLWELPEAVSERGVRTEPLALVGASPETLARIELRPGEDAAPERVVHVRPIAGTRPRGRDEAEDLALEQQLLADPKERAEHMMLVDLARNDIGRVAKVGSVSVDKLLTIERGSHVMHIVSEVSGALRDDVSALSAFAASFPAGTLTGAPKVRAMQIIREQEALPRNFYGGAIGYLLPSGELDFAIGIRTAVQRGEQLDVRAGGGVVLASEPQAEADETRNKAKAMVAAILSAARSSR